MKSNIILIISIILILSSCEKNENDYKCEAIVISMVNSGIVMCTDDPYNLKFISGLDIVESLTSDYQILDSIYTVVNLPEDLKIEGLEIKLNIRELKSGESPTCYNFEMPIFVAPVVYVTDAEQK
jgi:hypothetical protein